MRPRKTREIARALTGKGFRRSNTHHKYYFFYDENGRKTPVKTLASHGSKEVPKGILSAMSRQLHVSPGQFEQLLDCPLSEEEYRAHLQSGGHI